MSATLYAGPGKFYMSSIALWPESENGSISAVVNQGRDTVGSGMFGRQSSTQADGTVTIKLTFRNDNWGALPLLFPAYLGVKVGGTAAALLIDADLTIRLARGRVAAKIWTPDGRLYTFPRTAITRPPDLKLGVGKALFGDAEFTAIGKTRYGHDRDRLALHHH